MATGWFVGHAWGENIGWIRMSSPGPVPFGIRTSWTCVPPPPVPEGSPDLAVEKNGPESVLIWTAIPGATGYDVVMGGLEALRGTAGDFASATTSCVTNNVTHTATAAFPGEPDPGEGHWYLVRGVNCGSAGTYDSAAPSQSGSRDGEIAASGNGCS
jgi:hypothetical protein